MTTEYNIQIRCGLHCHNAKALKSHVWVASITSFYIRNACKIHVWNWFHSKIMNQQMINAFHLHDEEIKRKENKIRRMGWHQIELSKSFLLANFGFDFTIFYRSFQVKTFCCFLRTCWKIHWTKLSLKNHSGLCLFAFHFWLK